MHTRFRPSASVLCAAALTAALGAGVSPAMASPPGNIFAPHSTPAWEIHRLSLFVLGITGLIFVGVSTLLIYALFKFRGRADDNTEPPQVFGSVQIELSWTIIPCLIIVVLFLTTARVLFSVQDAPEPKNALEVTVIGHQFWWEFRYPQYGIVTANELHVPLSGQPHPRPTYMKLISADVMHSFWVPELAGKTDVLPNRVNEMWIDPLKPGMYVGQCAQFCGPQHAKMLIRVYVDTPDQFKAWVANQQRVQKELSPAQFTPVSMPNSGNRNAASRIPPNAPPTRGGVSARFLQASMDAITPQNGQRVFEQESCISCHTVRGTIANGRYGPDLTHLMSRETIGAGAAANTPGDLLQWVTDPNTYKPGCLMPAMHLTDRQNQQITAYLLTLK